MNTFPVSMTFCQHISISLHFDHNADGETLIRTLSVLWISIIFRLSHYIYDDYRQEIQFSLYRNTSFIIMSKKIS